MGIVGGGRVWEVVRVRLPFDKFDVEALGRIGFLRRRGWKGMQR